MIYKTNVVITNLNSISLKVLDAQIDCHIGERFGAEFYVWGYHDFLPIVGTIVDIVTRVGNKFISKTIYLELDADQIDDINRAIRFKNEALELEKREIILC